MKTIVFEEFLKNYERDADHYADQDYIERDLVRMMRDLVDLTVDMCSENAKTTTEEFVDGFEICIDKNSILKVKKQFI